MKIIQTLILESEAHVSQKERKKDILMSFKRPKWPISPNKREIIDATN